MPPHHVSDPFGMVLICQSHCVYEDGIGRLPVIPKDWALHATHSAGEWVEQQFLAHVAERLLVDPPPELDVETMLSCGQLALLMAEAYRHTIKLDIDIIRYNEALSKRESGMNDAQEHALLAKFPPSEKIMLRHPAVVLDSGYRIILWYILDALAPWAQNDMFKATTAMGDLLKKSIVHRSGLGWRTHKSNFRPVDTKGLSPGCINITPCWFQQGHECYGPLPEDPDDGFKPEVSAMLKGERSLEMIIDIQRPALLASVALRVMHPQLYWASLRTHVELGRWSAQQGLHDMHRLLKHWASVYTGAAVMCNRDFPCHQDPKCLPKAFDILTCIGSYQHAIMHLTNLGINLAYNPGVMVSYSGRLVRHGIRVNEGDQIVWAWFMRDSMHNYARTPCPDYAGYNPADLDACILAKYNQADFMVYGTL
ncbi:uncharacterized protein HD556DRAFT_1440791 [Suillus plorans]|uniref:Uncharacterized protein n=1 Tax=Suillus plorans TaxID=116603 RepID=A0A9P7IYR1_9AGAM|nr:uncharacterized protein HD556DRAFT_1440791 [Suillus plorans]KAG1797831.1 hypothetical protein HD556DRAFT_1440791 [Suillus plorans]